MSEENKSRLEGAIEQLRNHQTQLDADGIMVGVSREALDMALAALSAPKAEAVAWNNMQSAPKDGSIVRLLVVPDPEAWTPFDDSHNPYETIGFNNLADTQEDRWEFVGWDWNHDCFVTGQGEVIGWLPFHTSPVPALTDETVERVARAWASIDGKLVEFEDERKSGCSLMEEDTGTYEGYVTEAAELLRRSGLLAAFPSKGGGE